MVCLYDLQIFLSNFCWSIYYLFQGPQPACETDQKSLNRMTKYIFVTGGVTSSLGKGIVSASLAKLLQARGFKVTIQKFDPYINVDPGTLNPYEHGECYVTEDGAETDLDLGHYERFLNSFTTQANNVTTGRIYQSVINKEREGAYLGKTVQVIPHITDEIKRRMQLLAASGYDIIITEIAQIDSSVLLDLNVWLSLMSQKAGRSYLVARLDERRSSNATLSSAQYEYLLCALHACLSQCMSCDDVQAAMKVANMANTFHIIG